MATLKQYPYGHVRVFQGSKEYEIYSNALRFIHYNIGYTDQWLNQHTGMVDKYEARFYRRIANQ